jgi:hypothetical protein
MIRQLLDEAIAAVPEAGPELGHSIVGQAQLLRLVDKPGHGWIRVIVPTEFDDADYAAVAEIALNLLRAAKSARENPAGLILPDKPGQLVRPS